VTVGGNVLRAGPAAWRRGAGSRHRRRAERLVPRLLATIGDPARRWVAGPPLVSSTRTAVVPLGPPGGPPVAMAKLPGTRVGVSSQLREGRALNALSAEPAVGDFARFLPLRITDGYVGDQPFVLERAMPGIAADTVASRSPVAASVTVGAASAIGVLHTRTAHPAVVDAALLRRWVDVRVDIVARATRRRDALETLRKRLHAAWAGREVEIGWVHGDFWLGNVMVDPATGVAAGIIDWEWAARDELAAQDLVYACVHSRMLAGRGELGDVVSEMLKHPVWEEAELAMHSAAEAPVGPVIDPDVLLLVWLRQIAANLVQTPSIAHNPLWVLRNVVSVLRALRELPAVGKP
jgi:phosphotransferase family enzyme